MNEKEKKELMKYIEECASYLIKMIEMYNDNKKEYGIIELKGEKEIYYISITHVDKE